MHKPDNDTLRKVVNAHLGANAGEASKPVFEKTKAELIFTKTALSKAISLLSMEKYLEIVDQDSKGPASDAQAAATIVESYFIPLPTESINGAFARAKKESVAKLKSEVAQLKYFTFKDYSFKKRKKVAAKKIRATNFDNVRVERKRTT